MKRVAITAALAVGLWATTAEGAWKPMELKSGCSAMSFGEDGSGFLLRGATLGLKLHKLDGDQWDNGINVTIGSLGTLVAELRFLDAKTGFAVGSAPEVYRTQDGGATWKGVPLTLKSGGKSARLVDISMGTPQYGAVLGVENYTQVFVALTKDGGATWNEVEPPGGGVKIGVAGEGAIVVGGHTKGKAWIRVSTDNGKTWKERSITAKLLNDIDFIDAKTGFVLAQGVGPASDKNESVLVTVDGGLTWSAPSGAYLPIQALRMAWVDVNNGYIAGTNGSNKTLGFARTTDGGKTWKEEPGPSDAEYTQPSIQVNCLCYPGPAAYAGANNGKTRLLVNQEAGGQKKSRYGDAPVAAADAGSTADAGAATDAAGGADGADSPDAASASETAGSPSADSAGQGSGGSAGGGDDGGGCIAGMPGPVPSAWSAPLLLALAALMWRRRRLRTAHPRPSLGG